MELVSLAASEDLIRLTLRRPPLNFLNLELLRQVSSHLQSLGDSPACRALILDADGTAFCAGLEVSELTPETAFLLMEQFHQVVASINSFPRPTIAIVRGMTLGAGNELIACCDFVFGAEKASFGQPEIKVGSIPTLAPLVLPPLIGQRRTLEMILTGQLITAKRAEEIGLIHRALPEEQLNSAVAQLVATFRTLSSPVLEIALRSVRSIRMREFQDHLRDLESLFLNRLAELEDSVEGVKAFLEKRPPQWKNR